MDHSYKGATSALIFVILILEYVTLEFGTYRLILSGSPLSAGHGPLLAPGLVELRG
jgi:hypothetical protein